MRVFIGFVLIVGAVFYGGYANPKWKLYNESSTYAGGIMRLLIGLPGWIAIISLFIGKWSVCVMAALVTLLVLAIPYMKLKKDGYKAESVIVLILFAALGAYGRFVMAWTIIGLIPNRALARAAEIGWTNASLEMMENAARENASRPADTSSVWDDFMTTSSQPEETEEKKTVEVYRMNGMIRENLKVSRDGERYYDPEDGEWHRIK